MRPPEVWRAFSFRGRIPTHTHSGIALAKPFDATLNALIDLRPSDWADGFARLVGIPPGPSVSLDTDLATTLQADKLFRIASEGVSATTTWTKPPRKAYWVRRSYSAD